MDNNNTWRGQGQGQAQIPVGQVMGGEPAAAQGMETGDWRNQLQADSRQRIVNKIMETLKRHLPFSGQEGLQELKKIAVRFEEKIYTAAISQSDYLRKISLKMLTMETKSQNPMANSLQSNAASNNKNPQDTGSQSMQPQIQNQVHQLPIPMVPNQPQVRQQMMAQNIQSNMASTVATSSASLTSGLAPGGLSHGTMANVAGGQNPNIQNVPEMAGVNPNIVGGTSMGQGVPFANSQRQIPGRQQQEQQQQSQNTQSQLFYNQQLQQHIMKQKFQNQGNISQSLMQSQIQPQQNLLQPTQLQSTQQSSAPQPSQTMLQQQSQSALRPHQQSTQQQLPVSHQQPNSMQQQQQQPSTANIQQNQLIGQQNSVLDPQQQQPRMMAQQNNMQQQQTTSQQNNLTSMHQQQQQQQQNNHPSIHQQQIGQQNNLTSFQQQLVANQHGGLGLQANQQSGMLQQSKVAAPQQMQPNMSNLLPNQSQQSQSQPPQQHLMSQPGQLQQLTMQQAANPLQRDMQQRIQTPGSLLPQQPMIDQQKQLMQSQRLNPEVPLTSADSSSHMGNTNSGDWQEEIFQKIKSMSEMYFHDLNEMYQKIAGKLQQHDSLSQLPKNDQLEKLRYFKLMLEKLILFLRTNKNDIQPTHKEKTIAVEKQIVNILNSHRPRKQVPNLQQGQVPPSQMHPMQQSQQPQAQISQIGHENQRSSNMQQISAQGAAMQQNNLTNLQHNSLSSASNSRQNNIDTLQQGSNVDPGQGNTMSSIQQVAASSIQQNPVSGSQQMNMNSLSSQSGVTTLQSNVSSLQGSTNVLQPHIKQEQPMFSNQQLKQQYQQRQMQQQQFIHRQHLLQQQHQTAPQQSGQLPAQQIGQLNQINDSNDLKMRQQIGGKSGVLQQHQRSSYQHPQMKNGTQFSISSPQVPQSASPQIGHHPSPQLDQQNLLNSHRTGTPMQSANSPFIAPSPSISMVPSPMPGDSEKITAGVSSLSNAVNNVQHHNIGSSALAQSMAIGTPGISASPLLAEFTSPDGTHGVASTIVSGNANVVEQPLERLLKAVKSMSQKALNSSVSDISSVVSMVDRIAGSAPGNGSRAAAGEDLVAMTKCRLQARNFFTQDGPSGSKRMRRYTSAVPSNILSPTGSVNDSQRHLNGCESDGESTGASSIKRHGLEANHALEEELREINRRLIDTVVHISEDDVDPTAVSAAAEGREGTIVKCSFSAVALSPNLKSQYASAQMSPIQPLRLLVPNDYPNCSPVLLDKFPVEVSKEYEDLSIKAKSRFSISLRSLTQPMSLGDIAKTWDVCARAVISEYAQQSGGGTFGSKYGTWESCEC